MKFKTRAEDFSLKLGLVQGISERRATMPVLSHVLLNVNKNRIGISATDLETTMSTWSPAEVSKPGSIALPARKLYEIVKELETGRIWAILDVSDPEPPAADHPFRTLPNVTLTPHIAGTTGIGLQRLGEYVVEEVRRFANGEPPRYPVRFDALAHTA